MLRGAGGADHAAVAASGGGGDEDLRPLDLLDFGGIFLLWGGISLLIIIGAEIQVWCGKLCGDAVQCCSSDKEKSQHTLSSNVKEASEDDTSNLKEASEDEKDKEAVGGRDLTHVNFANDKEMLTVLLRQIVSEALKDAGLKADAHTQREGAPAPGPALRPAGPDPELILYPEVTAGPAPEQTGWPAPEVTAGPAPERTGGPALELAGGLAPERNAAPALKGTAGPAPERTAGPAPERTAGRAPERTGGPVIGLSSGSASGTVFGSAQALARARGLSFADLAGFKPGPSDGAENGLKV